MEMVLVAFNFSNIFTSHNARNKNKHRTNKPDFCEERAISSRACCHMIQRLRKCPPADSSYRECALRLTVRICIRKSTTKRRFVWTFCAVSVPKPNRLDLYCRISFSSLCFFMKQLILAFKFISVDLSVCHTCWHSFIRCQFLCFCVSCVHFQISVPNVMNSCAPSSRIKVAVS